jgi:hypothetical protein
MSEESKAKEPTYCDAEAAFKDGSYRSASDDELRAFHHACMGVNGPNQSAVDRIRRVGDLMWQELQGREERRRRAGSMADSLLPEHPVEPQTPLTTEASRPWDAARVKGLVKDGIGESLTLEYKRAAALSRDSKPMIEITKDVSAMANSAGGVLIYGIAEDPQTKQLSLDPVNQAAFPREWLEQVISQIRPRVAGLRIIPVEVGPTPDEIAYVVEVPEGATAHQATDHRYYRRYNFECLPMYDHEIRDLMNRTKHPQIEVTARLVVYPRQTRDNESGALVLHVENKSDVLARHVALVVDVPLRVRGKLVRYRDAIVRDGSDGSHYRCNFSNGNGSPLFPRATFVPVFQYSFIDRMMPQPAREADRVSVLVFADSMPKRTVVFRPEDILDPKPPAVGATGPS